MGRRVRVVVAGLLGTGLAASIAIGAGVPTPTQDGAGETARTPPADMQPTLVGSPAEWFGPENYPAAAMRASR